MGVKNIKEDIIYNIVEDVINNDANIAEYKIGVDDLVAYILNRIPPKYTTSERGILHGKLEARYIIQQKTDILLLLYEAIEIFKNRRETEAVEIEESAGSEKGGFSHVFGEVLEETTFSIVHNVEVTLLYDGRPAKMINSGWKNPYITTKAAKGFFHFFPAYEEKMGTGPKVSFELLLRHSKFLDKKVQLGIDLLDAPDLGKSHVVPIVLLQLKEGENLDFLEE